MQFTDLQIPTATHDSTASASHDGFDQDDMSTTAVQGFSTTAGVADTASCSAAAADDSPRVTGWLADGGGLSAVRLRSVREVQVAADRVLDSAGVGDLLGVTAFVADDGKVYAVRVVAVVREAEPQIARDLIASALADCPPANAARREVLESHLLHLPTCGADHTASSVPY